MNSEVERPNTCVCAIVCTKSKYVDMLLTRSVCCDLGFRPFFVAVLYVCVSLFLSVSVCMCKIAFIRLP